MIEISQKLNTRNKKALFNSLKISIFTIVLAIIISLIFLSQAYNKSIKGTIDIILLYTTLPSDNILAVYTIDGFPLSQFFGIFFLINLILTIILYRTIKLFEKHYLFGDLYITLMISSLLGLLFVTTINQTHRFNYIANKMTMKKRSTNQNIWSFIYNASKTTKNIIKRHCQADFISNLNIDTDPGMYIQRIVSYYLYPEVSIRFNNNQPKDCLVGFFTNGQSLINTEEYEPIIITNQNMLIVAIKKNQYKKYVNH